MEPVPLLCTNLNRASHSKYGIISLLNTNHSSDDVYICPLALASCLLIPILGKCKWRGLRVHILLRLEIQRLISDIAFACISDKQSIQEALMCP